MVLQHKIAKIAKEIPHSKNSAKLLLKKVEERFTKKRYADRTVESFTKHYMFLEDFTSQIYPMTQGCDHNIGAIAPHVARFLFCDRVGRNRKFHTPVTELDVAMFMFLHHQIQYQLNRKSL